jgi:hypothetical protein
MSATMATAIAAAAGITVASALTGTDARAALVPSGPRPAATAAASASAYQARQAAGRHRKHKAHLRHLAHLTLQAEAATAAAQQAAAYQGRHRAPAATQPALQAAAVQAAVQGPAGSPQAIAAGMLGAYGWAPGQMSCLDPLWQRESGWNVDAENASSGAYGIPQSLPASKMASAGADWQTSAATQIRWGLTYISQVYGTPCGAWAHSQHDGWY